MSGTFRVADESVGKSVVYHTDLSDLVLSVFLNGDRLGTRSLAVDGAGKQAAALNVNFDTVTEKFLIGGISTGRNGQNWFTSAGGSVCDTVGFSSGLYSQGVCVNGVLQSNSFVNTDIAVRREILSVERVEPEEPVDIIVTPVVVPVPAMLPAFGLVLGLGAFFARRRQRVRAT